MSAANSIDALREQLAQMTEQLARLQERNTTDRDPQIKNQRPSTVFYPSEAEARRYPPIKPNDPFFLFKHNISDEELWELFRAYPKNHAVGYEPPKIPNGMHSSSAQKAHDTQLRMIQKRIAHLTRSVDLFLHKIWPLEGKEHLDAEEMVELCSTFAILIRDQLAAVGGRITAMRMDNLRPTQGASFKQDPPTWSTHTKSRTRSNSSRLSRTHSSPARVFNNSNTDPTLRRTIAAPISRIRNGTSTVGTRTIHTVTATTTASLLFTRKTTEDGGTANSEAGATAEGAIAFQSRESSRAILRRMADCYRRPQHPGNRPGGIQSTVRDAPTSLNDPSATTPSLPGGNSQHGQRSIGLVDQGSNRIREWALLYKSNVRYPQEDRGPSTGSQTYEH